MRNLIGIVLVVVAACGSPPRVTSDKTATTPTSNDTNDTAPAAKVPTAAGLQANGAIVIAKDRP